MKFQGVLLIFVLGVMFLSKPWLFKSFESFKFFNENASLQQVCGKVLPSQIQGENIFSGIDKMCMHDIGIHSSPETFFSSVFAEKLGFCNRALQRANLALPLQKIATKMSCNLSLLLFDVRDRYCWDEVSSKCS